MSPLASLRIQRHAALLRSTPSARLAAVALAMGLAAEVCDGTALGRALAALPAPRGIEELQQGTPWCRRLSAIVSTSRKRAGNGGPAAHQRAVAIAVVSDVVRQASAGDDPRVHRTMADGLAHLARQVARHRAARQPVNPDAPPIVQRSILLQLTSESQQHLADEIHDAIMAAW